LAAVSMHSGEISWKTARLGRLECPLIVADSVYIRTIGETLYAIKRDTGQITGTLSVEANTSRKDQPDRGPVAVDGTLIVPVNSTTLVAFE